MTYADPQIHHGLRRPWHCEYSLGEPARDPLSSGLSGSDDAPWPCDRIEVSFEIRRELAGEAWIDPAVDKLVELLNLRSNWNGYGERRIHPSSAKRVFDLLNAIFYTGPEPIIVPLSTGSLQLEWHDGERSLEVEVPPSGPAKAWYVDDETGTEHEWIASTRRGVVQLAAQVRELLGA